jgi:hypothetical protein
MASVYTPAYPGQPPSGAAAGVLSNIRLTSNAASGLVKLGGPKRKNTRKSRKTRKTTRKNKKNSRRNRRR